MKKSSVLYIINSFSRKMLNLKLRVTCAQASTVPECVMEHTVNQVCKIKVHQRLFYDLSVNNKTQWDIKFFWS